MSFYRNLLMNLPEVASPTKKQTLKKRMLWTLGMLVLFLFLASIPLYGIDGSQAEYFKTLELLLGAKIGFLLTLGIGPIVTASIVLQLLKGSGIIKFDLTNEEGKFIYSGTHKLLTFAFIIIEAIVFVAFGAVQAAAGSFGAIPLSYIVMLQLGLGGFIVLYMDEIVKKWGFGSGVSLFIAAGIGQALFLQFFSPFTQTGEFGWLFGGTEVAIGKIWAALYYLSVADLSSFLLDVAGPILVTVGLFFIIVFFQSVNVEIPLSFGRVRGQSFRWPLNFFYSGVIPVILIAALGANLQLWARLLQNMAETGSAFTQFVSQNILGQFAEQTPISGLIYWITPVTLWDSLSNFFSFDVGFRMLTYTIYLVIGSTVFAYFWMQTAGLDSRSQAKQIINSGLQIPGFRKDERIIEKILDRYIVPLTLMGGMGIGLLASTADVLAALTSGTGILLLIMIIYQFYQQLARESMEDFSLLKRLMRK